MTYNEAFEILLKDGTIYQPPQDAIFEFVDAVLRRQQNRAYELYENCLGVGESVLVMLTVLYNNAKQVLQVQSCESKDIQQSTGLTAWQIKCAKEKTGKYHIYELVDLLQRIQKCESGIKSGQIEEDFVMDYLFVKTF